MKEPPPSPAAPGSGLGSGSEATDAASLAVRVEGRLDDLARRFDQSDWIELFAAVLLALATIVAAWSAYQATRWGGVQANSFSQAAALRSEANEAEIVAKAGLETDVEMFSAWLVLAAEGNEASAGAIEERLREEFRPAFDAWLSEAPFGQIPPGRPFDLPQYEQAAGDASRAANDLYRQAEEMVVVARQANQTGDDFVLVAVVMAAVLFFTGVSTKLRGRGVRIVMLILASAFFLLGLGFMVSLPQNVGI